MGTRWIFTTFSLEMRRLLSYRLDFWLHSFGLLFLQFGVAYFLWSALFAASNQTEINGFSFNEILVYYLFVPFISRIGSAAQDPGFSTDIYSGGLNKYLVYPVNFFAFKIVERLPGTLITFMNLVILTLALSALDVFHMEWINFLRGVISLAVVFAMCFFIFAFLEMFAFWMDNVWSLNMAFKVGAYFLGGGAIPISFFDPQVVEIIRYTPFALSVSFPVQSFLGEIATDQWTLFVSACLLWTTVFLGLTFLMWRSGRRVYSGVGM